MPNGVEETEGERLQKELAGVALEVLENQLAWAKATVDMTLAHVQEVLRKVKSLESRRNREDAMVFAKRLTLYSKSLLSVTVDLVNNMEDYLF